MSIIKYYNAVLDEIEVEISMSEAEVSDVSVEVSGTTVYYGGTVYACVGHEEGITLDITDSFDFTNDEIEEIMEANDYTPPKASLDAWDAVELAEELISRNPTPEFLGNLVTRAIHKYSNAHTVLKPGMS